MKLAGSLMRIHASGEPLAGLKTTFERQHAGRRSSIVVSYIIANQRKIAPVPF